MHKKTIFALIYILYGVNRIQHEHISSSAARIFLDSPRCHSLLLVIPLPHVLSLDTFPLPHILSLNSFPLPHIPFIYSFPFLSEKSASQTHSNPFPSCRMHLSHTPFALLIVAAGSPSHSCTLQTASLIEAFSLAIAYALHPRIPGANGYLAIVPRAVSSVAASVTGAPVAASTAASNTAAAVNSTAAGACSVANAALANSTATNGTISTAAACNGTVGGGKGGGKDHKKHKGSKDGKHKHGKGKGKGKHDSGNVDVVVVA